ncbi:hypothetical protein BBP40_008211 [Aspergillus hancockii]|nr:hypothetical protein BBP40_008211 [Aspergillus hancockii]
MSSRWANEDPETEAIVAQRKREKEEKRRAKAEKQRLEQEQREAAEKQKQEEATQPDTDAPPKKRRRLSNDTPETAAAELPSKPPSTILQFPTQEWGPCRHVDNFERLNHIEEGSYGWVSRAKDITTGEIVALKKLKMDNSPDGFPVTGLREIQTLLEARHQNVVYLREIVVGSKMDEYVCVSSPSPPYHLTTTPSPSQQNKTKQDKPTPPT